MRNCTISRLLKSVLVVTTFGIELCAARASGFPSERDPLRWPFAADSIWNTPIGSEARYVPANIPPHARLGPEEEIIILTPAAPAVNLVEHKGGWNKARKRADAITGRILETNVPIPFAFSTDPGYYGVTPNQSAAILLTDGRTLIQNQPFHRVGLGGPAITQFRFPRTDLYGDGVAGSHGGSGMSAIGGCIRVGELVPGGVLRHALKVVLWGKLAFHYSQDEADGKPGYRWPAFRADGYASTNTYAGKNPELQVGSLLALKPDFKLPELATEPARMIARALQDYGAYVIDDSAWSFVGLCVEWGPDGRVLDEFKQTWGFALPVELDSRTQWASDIQAIMAALEVVANNGPESKGGGGVMRQPKPPPFRDAQDAQASK
jgi:hypothetical protein